MSYQTQGASNRNIYDCCDYAQQLQQSVDPLQYYLYFGAQENCSKCIDKKAWFRQDKEVVDVESELWNITRPLSRCDQFKYNPNCKTSPECISTFAENTPKILSPSLCPIVYNNIPVQTSPGYKLPNPNICTGNDYREADDINTYAAYNKSNAAILGNSHDPQNAYMFINSCSNTPLYQGSSTKVDQMLASNGIPYAWQMHENVDNTEEPTGIQHPMYGSLKNDNNGNKVSAQNIYEPQREVHHEVHTEVNHNMPMGEHVNSEHY